MPLVKDGLPRGNRTKRLHLIDYYTVPWSDVPAGTPPVVMIASKEFATGRETLFAWHLLAEQKRMSPDDIRSHQGELERLLLEEFAGFLAANPKARWVHWGLDSIDYGFPALKQRAAFHGVELGVVPQTLYNLSNKLKTTYGRHYIPHPRLRSLVTLNQINQFQWLSTDELTAAYQRGEFRRIMTSLRRKVICIGEILQLFMGGTLQIHVGTDLLLAHGDPGPERGWLSCARATLTQSDTLPPEHVNENPSEEGKVPLENCNSDSKTSPPDSKSEPKVLLGEPGDCPIVLGKKKRRLTKAGYDVVKAVLEAGETGLTKDELVEKSGHGDARGVLNRLAEKDPDWRSVIQFAGHVGGGYRIK